MFQFALKRDESKQFVYFLFKVDFKHTYSKKIDSGKNGMSCP